MEKNIFIHAQRLPLELVYLMKFVLSQNPITHEKLLISLAISYREIFWQRLFRKLKMLPKATDYNVSQESEENEV